jgi:hypothetical protein
MDNNVLLSCILLGALAGLFPIAMRMTFKKKKPEKDNKRDA